MKAVMQNTGAYVLVHHGADGKDLLPYFKVDPLKAVQSPHHYTASLARADIFSDYGMAKAAAENENEFLKAEGHPLAGHIEVAELFVHDCGHMEGK